MRTAVIVVAMLAAIPALAHSWYPLACCGNIAIFDARCCGKRSYCHVPRWSEDSIASYPKWHIPVRVSVT
jgi:hypothetical protein